MRKKFIFLAFFLSFNCLAEALEVDEVVAYRGTISDQNVFMTLSAKKDRVVGSYFYDRYKVPIALHGSVSGSRLLLIEETIAGNAYVELENSRGIISGAWVLGERKYKVQAKALSVSYQDLITEIEVVGIDSADKKLLINFIGGERQSIEFSTLEASVLIIFEDYTFDGFPDMRILEFEAGGNSSFIYFDYDVATGRYVNSSAEISALVSPRVIHNERAVISISKDGCCVYQVKKITPKEVHFANYNFDSKVGFLSIASRDTGGVSKKPITQKQFEESYLSYMSPVRTPNSDGWY